MTAMYCIIYSNAIILIIHYKACSIYFSVLFPRRQGSGQAQIGIYIKSIVQGGPAEVVSV
jgi:hypothetical protein